MDNKKLKFKIALGIIIFVLILSILSGGSDVVKNYTPDGNTSTVSDDLKDIEYNKEVLNEVTGGYSGSPKLVKSDDRVFYIPPEYCSGQYLKNFRVIGINQSNAKITEKEGDITDYSGAVVLYGFQTTYRSDYGKNYDFDYEPYDYDTEYEVVDDYFTSSVNKLLDKETTEETTNKTTNKETEKTTEETTFRPSNPLKVKSKKNKNSVDDSNFKVATIVMEHEIGKDESKILYCDADACTVKDLDVGKFNLVTNLNDSALTVCHNEKIYVYSFNEKESSYGSKEVYYYSLNDLFDSITFKNTLADIGYCKVKYSVVGDLSYSNSSSGWVSTWLSKMNTRKTTNVLNTSYLSNLTASTAEKDKIKENFIDMEEFAKDEVDGAYKRYKKTSSGWASYKHSSKVYNFDNYIYQSAVKNCWKLESTFDIKLTEKSWLVLFPKTYTGSAKGKATITITPDFTLLSNYNYSINDMILTKFNGDNSSNTNEYSIVIQMLVTPVDKIEEEDKMESISDFDKYAKDVVEKGDMADSEPEGADESDLEERAKDDANEQEEYIEQKISAKYITLNINLAQIYGTEKSEDIEIISISDTKEVDDYFKQAKKNYKAEYDNNISAFDNEVKKGGYVVPKDFTVESLKEFKGQYNDIKAAYDKLKKAREELEELENDRNGVNEVISENISAVNTPADDLDGEYKINDKFEELNYIKITYADIFNTVNNYDFIQISEKEAEIQKLESELNELKVKYDETKFYADLYWKNKKLNSDALIANIDDYDKIINVIDEYINNFGTLLKVDDKRENADKFISNIKALNTDENINRVLSDMYIGLVNNEAGREKYGSAFNDLVYLYNNKTRFYADISAAVNYLAAIKSAEVNETNAEDIKKENININMINEYVEKYYGKMSKNVLETRTYSEICSDCKKIYGELFDSFSKVVIQENGIDKEICDVAVSDVENSIYTLFLDKYGITELNDYNKDGTPAKTVTLAKNNTSRGNIYEASESSTETTTEAVYYNTLSSVYSGYANLKKYSNELKQYYAGITDIAADRLLKSGCLTEEQQMAVKVDDENIDKDITSDYNTGYQKAVDICNELSELLDGAKTYYEVREDAAKRIGVSINSGLRVNLRDDIYYEELYRTKCNDADHIYRLLYNAAKAKNETERQKYVDEYNNTKWTVTDINVDSDLRSAIVVKSKYISSTYQKVNWNTSLIRADVKSNASITPYELYQMNSNFCIGISDNDGFIVPMGAQADVDVRSLNKKISDEIKAANIDEIENVAYGYDKGYDLLLFSGNGKWFMIAFEQKDKEISVDTNEVIGYSGYYKAGSEDIHFLEYDHTDITGVNQLFSTSLENGYKPYKITLSSLRNGKISEETTAEDGSGAKGMDGAFFNSWSDDKGNVILLGFKEEDMELEEETENTTESVINYEEYTEETTAEKKTRQISDMDIYDAHLYVLRYETKKAEVKDAEDEASIWYDDGNALFDAGIRLEGFYGKLLEPAVNILTLAFYAVLALAYALAVLYCVHLGIKYSGAESDEEKYNAKSHIKWFIIAFVGVHILVVFLKLGAVQLEEWSDRVVIQNQVTTEENVTENTTEK